MGGSRQDGHLPEREMHNMQQRKGAKADTRANPLLRRARKARTWSQAELAEHIGVAKETISRWENGISRPQPQQLRQLCETFQITPEALGYAPERESELEEKDTPAPDDPPRSLLDEAQVANGLAPSTPTAPQTLKGSAISSLPAVQPALSRRAMVVSGIALGGLALAGGMLAWLSSTHQEPRNQTNPSPRHWPILSYDPKYRKSLVYAVQQMLQARQQDIGPSGPDSVFGTDTQRAVKNFQKDQHLAESGVVDDPTWEKLIVPSSKGDSGDQVIALQDRLLAFKLLPSPRDVDGIFGPLTAQAVQSFQRLKYLSASGFADLNTWCLLVGGKLST